MIQLTICGLVKDHRYLRDNSGRLPRKNRFMGHHFGINQQNFGMAQRIA